MTSPSMVSYITRGLATRYRLLILSRSPLVTDSSPSDYPQYASFLQIRVRAVQTVVITGAAGLLGTVLTRGLEGRYRVVGLDRTRRRPAQVRRVDMARPRSLDTLFEGADAVVDLAGLPAHTTPWKDVWKNNLPATMNALEAARRAGARRYVFASSNHVTGMYERDAPYSAIVAGEYGGLEPRS